eukprot:g7552.t1
MENLRSQAALDEQQSLKAETERLKNIVAEWTARRNKMEKMKEDLFYLEAQKISIYNISGAYIGYDEAYGTRRLSPCFMMMLANHMDFHEPAIRERVYGVSGEVNTGFKVEGPVELYKCWEDAKPLSCEEKKRLRKVQADIQSRIARIDRLNKFREEPYDFENLQTMQKCYEAVSTLMEGPWATPIPKPDEDKWVFPYFGKAKNGAKMTWRDTTTLAKHFECFGGTSFTPTFGKLDLYQAAKGEKVPPDRIQEIFHRIEELNGVFVHCTFWRNVKRGLPLTRYLYLLVSKKNDFGERIVSKGTIKIVKILINKMKKEVQKQTPMVILQSTALKQRLHLMTDAAANEVKQDVSLGGILFAADGSSTGFSLHIKRCEVPLPLRRASIMVFELVAVLMAQKIFKKETESANLIVHCDNQPAVYGIVKGSVKCPLSTGVITCICDDNMDSSAFKFYGYINTHANPADACTRTDMLFALDEAYKTKFPYTKEFLMKILEEIAEEVVQNMKEMLL